MFLYYFCVVLRCLLNAISGCLCVVAGGFCGLVGWVFGFVVVGGFVV